MIDLGVLLIGSYFDYLLFNEIKELAEKPLITGKQ